MWRNYGKPVESPGKGTTARDNSGVRPSSLGFNQPTTYVTMTRQPWRSDRVIRGRARQLRRDMTKPELMLWAAIRNGQLDGYHFRRQHPMGDFVVDFFCARARLVIEIDGDSHAGRREYDQTRTAWLMTQKDYQVVRVTNDDVLSDVMRVRRLILKRLSAGPT